MDQYVIFYIKTGHCSLDEYTLTYSLLRIETKLKLLVLSRWQAM